MLAHVPLSFGTVGSDTRSYSPLLWCCRNMGDLAPRTPALPTERRYRPVRRSRYYARVARVNAMLPRAENLLAASQLRLVRLLEAFALERLQPLQYRHASIGSEIEAGLAAGRPRTPEELRYVIDQWPEFREFLARHDILGAS